MKIGRKLKGGQAILQNNSPRTGIKKDVLICQRSIATSFLLSGLCFFYLLGFYNNPTNFIEKYACASGAKINYDYRPKFNIPANRVLSKSFATLPANSNKVVLAEKAHNELYYEILPILEGTPMEVMAEQISKKSPEVAGFLIGIAMKESKFGNYAPEKNGSDCYNYWGYRGKENPTWSGYSCFDTPAQAISVVGKRIQQMVDNGANSPEDMISWKCGSTCAGHDSRSVKKWITDVGIHYFQIVSRSQVAKNNF